MDISKVESEQELRKLKEENEELVRANLILEKRTEKLKSNGIRNFDARLEVIEEDMAVVWKLLAKLENMEGQIDNIHSDLKLTKDYSRSMLMSTRITKGQLRE